MVCPMGKKGFFMGLCLMFCVIFPVQSGAADRIVVVSDRWMPYNGEPGTAKEGGTVEIRRTAFESKGFEVKYLELPRKRAVADVLVGRADILIGAVKAEMDDFIYPEYSLGRADLCFFTNRSDWRFTGPDSLKTVITGYVQGHNYPKWLLGAIERHPERFHALYGGDAFARIFGMLREDRVQVVPAPRAVAKYYMRRNGLEDSVYCAGCSEADTQDLYFALSPVNPVRSRLLADILDKGVSTMRNIGQLNHLLIKYGFKDWMNSGGNGESAEAASPPHASSSLFHQVGVSSDNYEKSH
eukprot:TRINITY_DN8496_c0_g1_i2.p1 TRINITY_DN8496_c0_g1~~TRINITY_DN8496_c0_g1_i2.p1  ORF type:complete len:298 (+),score=44.07 TRINITY_DN8496_c0_g1_i2:672-1565(+)